MGIKALTLVVPDLSPLTKESLQELNFEIPAPFVHKVGFGPENANDLLFLWSSSVFHGWQ